MADSTPNAVHECPACRIIDQADGLEDGKLYRTADFDRRSERHILAAFKRTEDAVADKVTAFA
ncbi:MAG: hypothetical protein QOI47_476, partial [Actinomycetota bacterium]|nr:hypothetical protein [Actinomycetota bacterium]